MIQAPDMQIKGDDKTRRYQENKEQLKIERASS